MVDRLSSALVVKPFRNRDAILYGVFEHDRAPVALRKCRFSEFAHLHEKVTKECEGFKAQFPRKTLRRHQDAAFVEQRRRGLQEFLLLVVTDPLASTCESFRTFFQSTANHTLQVFHPSTLTPVSSRDTMLSMTTTGSETTLSGVSMIADTMDASTTTMDPSVALSVKQAADRCACLAARAQFEDRFSAASKEVEVCWSASRKVTAAAHAASEHHTTMRTLMKQLGENVSARAEETTRAETDLEVHNAAVSKWTKERARADDQRRDAETHMKIALESLLCHVREADCRALILESDEQRAESSVAEARNSCDEEGCLEDRLQEATSLLESIQKVRTATVEEDAERATELASICDASVQRAEQCIDEAAEVARRLHSAAAQRQEALQRHASAEAAWKTIRAEYEALKERVSGPLMEAADRSAVAMKAANEGLESATARFESVRDTPPEQHCIVVQEAL